MTGCTDRMTGIPAPRVRALDRTGARAGTVLLPTFSLLIVLLAINYFNPRAISYFGFNLMLNLAVPVALATMAQLCVITVNDLDLSIGAYVGFHRLRRRDTGWTAGLARALRSSSGRSRSMPASVRWCICASCPRSW